MSAGGPRVIPDGDLAPRAGGGPRAPGGGRLIPGTAADAPGPGESKRVRYTLWVPLGSLCLRLFLMQRSEEGRQDQKTFKNSTQELQQRQTLAQFQPVSVAFSSQFLLFFFCKGDLL